MKPSRLLFIISILFFAFAVSAQKPTPVFLKDITLRPNPNITVAGIDSFNRKAVRINDKAFGLLQFNELPTELIKTQLANNGIVLLDYLPDNAYTVSIKGAASLTVLLNASAKVLMQLAPEQKMHSALTKTFLPQWAVKVPGTVDVLISFPKTFTATEVLQLLKEKGFQILSFDLAAYRILSVRVAANRLTELAAFPFIEYVQPAPNADQPLNQHSRASSRANILNASIANGGKGLNGEGVVIGIGDNADVQTHFDFSGRLINRAATVVTGHGQHVTGTAAGAGNVNELYRGYAPKATIVSQVFSGILNNAATYVKDYGMVITNNSYGNINECDYHGTYDLYSRLLDQQAFELPSLENVFAAGNSGGDFCPPNAQGFHTVYGGYQSAKNVLSVGATTDSGSRAYLSSKGPVRDGRIKPEITAKGELVISSWPNNTYSYDNGTSMAAPAVSGGLALLYQRYRQLHSGTDPKSNLMKAVLCNGATDKGNDGPDFSNGFGSMNLLRSVEMIEKNQYFSNVITPNATASHLVTVPPNTAQLKVLLYWNDPAASLLSRWSLVNDLDLEVLDPSSSINYPKVLDTTVANLDKVATTGPDHANNIEQVVINNPPAGTYTFKIKGTTIAQNPSQDYVVAYDVLPVSLQITYPAAGEPLVPNGTDLDMVKISWEAYGNPNNTFNIQYSADGGLNWNDIVTNLDGARRIYTWFVPNIATGNALVRIVQNGTGLVSTSKPFTILSTPTVSLAPVQCEGYASISWNAVNGATDYELMMLRGDEMKSVGTTTALTYTFSGLNKDSTYLFSVRPRINGNAGRRATAIIRQPNTGNCSGTISDNDLKLDAIISPLSGRVGTSAELKASTPITIQIKNLDDAPASNFAVQYRINSGIWVTENVSATIPPGGTYNYTFSTTANMAAVGTYSLTAVVKNAVADVVAANDTMYRLVKQLDNQPINLATTFLDNMESATAATYNVDTAGLQGLDRYDFENATLYGRLRTFVNSGIAYSGAKALTMDADRLYQPGNTNFLMGTYNVSNYNAITNDLRLDFEFNNHGQVQHPENKVWIRGADNQPWIEVYDLNTTQNPPGIYKKTASFELSDLLANGGQNFSSSFQIRWGQYGQIQATDKENAAGYTFDDIRLYQVFNDLQMISIDSPVVVSCGLSTNNVIKVTVRNSANTALTNIPVKYRVDNGAWISEIISSIPGNTSFSYSFLKTADLASFGVHKIEAVVDFAADSFHDNDTTSVILVNAPVITSFPYLQNFEKDNGYWYAGGKNASWEYGTPASVKINGAASGAKAWKTRLAGNYNDEEASYLFSPCYDISSLTTPTLSFSMALDVEDCGTTLCDAVWVEYSTDGTNWKKLGTSGTGTNWYNQQTDDLWSQQNYTRWHVATVALPKGLSRLRLRFVFKSDPAVNREGLAIDDIHIYDNTKGIYVGPTLSAPITQTISGTDNWIDFESGGKLVASILPKNQSLGLTDVQVFINKTGMRNSNNQYYHDRNLTVKPTTVSVADSVAVRFYFLDSETDSLINAKNCTTCSKPLSAYDLGISKYSDADDAIENGTIADNKNGLWSFIDRNKIAIVPFDKGYYAEFTVKDFSEFWLSKAPLATISAASVQLLNFTAQKASTSDKVIINWTTAAETNVWRYEVEVARSNDDLAANRFVKLGVENSIGTASQHNYTFEDGETPKTGVRYYRLKIIYVDGSFRYSEVKAVLFSDVFAWQVYPNPSSGQFYIVYQVAAGTVVPLKLMDAAGRLLKEYNLVATGFIQKFTLDLSGQPFPSGVYLLQAPFNGNKNTFKLYKQ